MGVGGAPPSGKGVTREGSLANKGTSLRGMDNNFLFLWVCVLQVTSAYESIVLYMCSGKYNDIYFEMKITFFALFFPSFPLTLSCGISFAPFV